MKDWKSQMKKYIFSIDSTKKDIKQGFDLKYRNIPNSLFRYYPFSNRSFNYLKLNLAYFSSPLNFNDPFDCNLSLLDNYIGCYLRYLVANVLTLDDSKREHLLNSNNIIDDFDFLDKNNLNMMVEEYNKSLGLIKNGFSVTCFSENFDNLLMWAHYTKNHTGFCVEYDFKSLKQEDSLVKNLFPIFYSDNFVDMSKFLVKSYFEEINNLYPQLAAISKSKSWEYEKEWRIVYSNFVNDVREMPPIKSVYLGINMKQHNKSRIINLAKKKGFDLYQMEMSKNSYKIIPNKIIF